MVKISDATVLRGSQRGYKYKHSQIKIPIYHSIKSRGENREQVSRYIHIQSCKT